MNGEICFAKVFPTRTCNQEYHIRIYTSKEMLDKDLSNFCPFSLRQIKRHIDECRKIVPFWYSIDRDRRHRNRIVVKLKISGPAVNHRFVLTWTRYLYEYPYNMYLLDATRLKRLSPFSSDNMFNLINLVGASFGTCGTGHTIGSLSDPQYKRTLSQIREAVKRIAEDGNPYMGDSIFGINSRPKHPVKNFGTSKKFYEWEEYWNMPETFLDRLETYKTNYKSLK